MSQWRVVIEEKTLWNIEVDANDGFDAEELALALFEQGSGTRGETFVNVREFATEETTA